MQHRVTALLYVPHEPHWITDSDCARADDVGVQCQPVAKSLDDIAQHVTGAECPLHPAARRRIEPRARTGGDAADGLQLERRAPDDLHVGHGTTLANGSARFKLTPRRGKAVEINALWYNTLRLMQHWSRQMSAG